MSRSRGMFASAYPPHMYPHSLNEMNYTLEACYWFFGERYLYLDMEHNTASYILRNEWGIKRVIPRHEMDEIIWRYQEMKRGKHTTSATSSPKLTVQTLENAQKILTSDGTASIKWSPQAELEKLGKQEEELKQKVQEKEKKEKENKIQKEKDFWNRVKRLKQHRDAKAREKKLV